jgi:hypothetical protein
MSMIAAMTSANPFNIHFVILIACSPSLSSQQNKQIIDDSAQRSMQTQDNAPQKTKLLK